MKNNTVTENTFDAIIIGSGIGGLATGAILSKVNKKRVLILEKHFEIGGLTHDFSRGRYKWEVGMHYIGRMQKGMAQRIMFDFITDRRIKWLPIPEPFERFIYPDISFGASAPSAKFKKNLIEKFPKCKKEIKRYFRDIHKASNWFIRYFLTGFLPRPVSLLIKLMNKLTERMPLQTVAEYLDKNISDKNLAAILSSQWGNYGIPPKEAAFTMHAAVVNHFMEGAYFPEGGSHRIAAIIENVIERNDGMILVNRFVKGIILENNRAIGVQVLDKRYIDEKEEMFYAPIIISDSGAENTYKTLIDTPSIQKVKKMLNLLKREIALLHSM